MMKKLSTLLFGFCLAIFALLLVQARAWASDKDFPPPPNPPRLVNDLAGFMNGAQQAALEQKLLAYADSTSNEIAIVTVQSIGQYDIADYTIQLFNKWKIGDKKNNNGLLILASKEERKIWITTGYGLEGALPDGLVGQIIRDQIQPYLKNGQFFEGFDAGTSALMQAAAGEYKATPKKTAQEGQGGIGTVLLIIIILLVILAISRKGGRGGGGGGLLSDVGWIAASMLSNSHSRGGGWGGSSGGGGGFGGFGGGSSGGGGAGGSW